MCIYIVYIGFISLAFRTQTNFDLGSLSLGLIDPKFIGACSAQLHGTNIQINERTVWGCNIATYFVISCIYIHIYVCVYRIHFPGLTDPNKFWPGFTFPRPYWSKIDWGSFRSASRHQHSYRIRFPWPFVPKQNLTYIYLYMYSLIVASVENPNQPYIYIYIQPANLLNHIRQH